MARLIACRARVTASCLDGKPTSHQFGEDLPLTEDGTFDDLSGTIVCDACYIALGQPLREDVALAIGKWWYSHGGKLPPFPYCDFCNVALGAKVYPARDVTTEMAAGRGTVTSTSQGAWVACRACAGKIDRGDREALLLRSMETVFRLHPPMPPGADRARVNDEVRAALRQLQDDFWRSREGAGVALRDWNPDTKGE